LAKLIGYFSIIRVYINSTDQRVRRLHGLLQIKGKKFITVTGSNKSHHMTYQEKLL